MKKRGLSFDRHKEIGKKLSEIDDYLTHIACEIGNAYPLNIRNGKPFRALGKTRSGFSMLRSELEELFYKDCPDQASKYIYYPGAQRE
jgi:hypothetical protein